MALKTYSEKLKDVRWQKKRLLILSRDNFSCTACQETTGEMHVHHEMYIGDPWMCPNSKLKTLCSSCHTKEHEEQKERIKFEPFEYRKFFIKEIDDVTEEIISLNKQVDSATDKNNADIYRALLKIESLIEKKISLINKYYE